MINIEIKCCVCKKTFVRSQDEIDISNSVGKVLYCSRGCCGTGVSRNRVGKNLGITKDGYSPYRYFTRKVKSRNKDVGVVNDNVTTQYLKQVFDSQHGICPLSGIVMFLPPNTTYWKNNKVRPDTASLDRIDSDRGYEIGNLRFVTYMANICRNTFTDQEVINFCKAVANNSQVNAGPAGVVCNTLSA